MPATIGIDLGASKCCVASVHDGKLEVLPNVRGDKTTPSFVAFNDRRCLVGSDAEEQATLNPKNTVYGIKSILGRTYLDPVVRNYTRFSSANVFNVQGQPAINVEYRDRCMSVSPLLISAMQILDMKQQAERVVGEVGGAVVSVPAYFGNSQREAIVAACHIAGLELLDLISEPTATTLMYRENRGSISGQETILVFDMGAAKLDVSVIRVSEEEVRVLAVCGDDSLGGDYLNEILMQYVDDKFDDTDDMSLLEDGRAMLKLKLACEEMKAKLTLLSSHRLQRYSVLNQKDLVACMTRKKFEKLFARKFSSDLRAILDSVLSSAKLIKPDIDEVVVVGGSSRVPIIQTLLSKFFGKKELNKTVNIDKSVATGAAILANELAKEEQHRKFVLHELVRVPDMGCSREVFNFHKYVPSLSGIRFPVAVERTLSDGSTEREQTYLSPEKLGLRKIKEVVVKNPTTDNKNEEKTVAIINKSEVEEAKSQLETFVQDRIELENDDKAQNDLEGYCYSLMEDIDSSETFFLEIDKVKDLSHRVLDWVEKNDRATVEECKKEGDCLRETWRKFNEDSKKKNENYLAVIEAFERSNEEISADVESSNEEERTLGTEKIDRVETKNVCAVCRKLETEEAEAREEEIEVARRLTELQDFEKKKLALVQEIEKLSLEKKHETDEKELIERQETEEKKLIERQDAEKKKQEVENMNLEKQQEAENEKLAEQQETEKRKFAKDQEAKEKKLEAEIKKLAEQQEVKEKKLAASQEIERKNHIGDENKLAKPKDVQKITLAEQLEKEKQKLSEEQEKERKERTREQEALIEKLEAEWKKLAAQHQTARKKPEDEKKRAVEQQETKNTELEANMNRLVNQQKIEKKQLEKKQEAVKKTLARQQEAEKKILAEHQEDKKKRLAERQEAEKKRLTEQQEAERKKRLVEQRETERKKRLAEQQEAERKKRLVEQQEEERKKILAEQQEAERKKRLVEQQEKERKKRLAEQQEEERKKRLVKQQEEERKRRLVEQLETERKKRLADQQEAEKRLAEHLEAESKKRLVEQLETERKKRLAKQQEEKKKRRLAKQQEEEERWANHPERFRYKSNW